MHWRNLPLVAFDTETTGLDPYHGDRIIEFAAVVFTLSPDGTITDRTDHAFMINPGREIPREITRITGITEKDVAKAPPFEEVAKQIHGLFKGAITVAHNYPFDLAFLTQEFERCGLSWPEPMAEVDTFDLSKKYFPEAKKHRLVDFCKRLDVVLENAHRATEDAAACGQSFITLARQRNVDDHLQSLIDWAEAIGRPPEDGALGTDAQGRVVFTEGPHEGEPIAAHPIHLQWMCKAREKGPDGWHWKYSESSRRWAKRWLNTRGSGRTRVSPKTAGAGDWALDSCITLDRSNADQITGATG